MRKRLKDHREVCHYWAHKVQPFGQCGDIFFEGDVIYSYGRHFPMAAHAAEGIVLLTTRKYSVSTAKHLSLVRWATPLSYRVIEVPNASPRGGEHLENLKDFQRRIDKEISDLSRCRQGVDRRLREISSLQEQANVYRQTFLDGKGTLPVLPADFQKIIEKAREREARKDFADAAKSARQREAREERERLNALNLDEKIIAWREGKAVSLPRNMSSVLLRLKGDTVETSKGARVPLGDAETVYRLWRRCGETGGGYLPAANNEFPLKVGVYTLNMIDTDGNIRIGCHTITPEEAERFAQERGWTK